jgi:hypothetical protein
MGRDRARYPSTRFSIPPVVTVRAAFTAYGRRLSGYLPSFPGFRHWRGFPSLSIRPPCTLRHLISCGPSPCTRLSCALSVESEEVGRESPASVRSIKRRVQFSRTPLSSAAPPWSHRRTRPGRRCVSRTKANAAINRRVGYCRHSGFRQRLARNASRRGSIHRSSRWKSRFTSALR